MVCSVNGVNQPGVLLFSWTHFGDELDEGMIKMNVETFWKVLQSDENICVADTLSLF